MPSVQLNDKFILTVTLQYQREIYHDKKTLSVQWQEGKSNDFEKEKAQKQ